MMMNFNELPEFQKEFKQLGKKYRSLPNDLREFRKVVAVIPLGNSKHFNIIAQTETICVLKVRLFCKCLKGSSLRIICAYCERERRIEFMEVYFKGNKPNENSARVRGHLKSLSVK